MNCTLFGLRRTTFYGGGAGLIHWERWSGLERDEMTMHGWNGACGFSESLFDSFITSPRERTRGGGTAWGRLRRGAPSPAPPLGPPPRPNPREEEDSLSIAAGRDEAYWKLTGRVSASRRCSSVTRHTWIPQPHEPFPSNPPDESHCISTHFLSAKKVRRNVARRIILKKRHAPAPCSCCSRALAPRGAWRPSPSETPRSASPGTPSPHTGLRHETMM